MNVREMKKALVEICDHISTKDCMTTYCPLLELCVSSHAIPRSKEDDDIVTMYNEAVRQGLIKED